MSRMPRCWFFLFHTKQVFSANKLTHTRCGHRRPNTLTHTPSARLMQPPKKCLVSSLIHSLTQTESRHNSWQQHQFYFEKSVTRVQNTNDPPNGRVSRAQQSSKNAFLLRVQVLIAQEMNQQRYASDDDAEMESKKKMAWVSAKRDGSGVCVRRLRPYGNEKKNETIRIGDAARCRFASYLYSYI